MGVLGEKDAAVKQAHGLEAKWMKGLKRSFADASKQEKAQRERDDKDKKQREKEEREEQRKRDKEERDDQRRREADERKIKAQELALQLGAPAKKKRAQSLFVAATLRAGRGADEWRGTGAQDSADESATTEPTGGHDPDGVSVA